jgi:hypothetical protein
MNFLKLPLVICTLILFKSCSKEEIKDEISYEIIDENSLSYSAEEKIQKQFKVFRSETDWLDFLPQIEEVNPNQAEHLKNINFDFSNNDLIIVIGEFFNNCCSQINIRQVYRDNGRIMVDFEETGPGIATALSQAYLILKIKKDK